MQNDTTSVDQELREMCAEHRGAKEVAALKQQIGQLAAQLDSLLRAVDRTAEGTAESRQLLGKGLAAIWREVHEPQRAAETPPQDAGAMLLSKSMLPAGVSTDAQRVVSEILKSWFGPHGGKIVRSREVVSRLLLSKALTQAEYDRWRKSGRVPDWVDLSDPQRAHAAAPGLPGALKEMTTLHLCGKGSAR